MNFKSIIYNIWICVLLTFLLPLKFKVIPIIIEIILGIIIINKFNKILDSFNIILAYNIQGGGTAPTQFYWNDKKYYYYFRLRSGHWRLHKGKIDQDDIEYLRKSKIIAEGDYGDKYCGYITFEDMQKLLISQGIKLNIKTYAAVEQFDI